jgi:hypothetical protein
MTKFNAVFEFEGEKFVKSKRDSNTAKIGDLIRITTTEPLCDLYNYGTSVFYNKIFHVTDIRLMGINVIAIGGYVNFEYFDILEPAPKTTPRPHAELIKQWADDDSLEIEFREDISQGWEDTYQPAWIQDHQYRFKPKTVLAWQVLFENKYGEYELTLAHYKSEQEFYTHLNSGQKFICFVPETEKQIEA